MFRVDTKQLGYRYIADFLALSLGFGGIPVFVAVIGWSIR